MDKKFVMGIAAMAALTLVSCSSDDLDSVSDNSSKNEAISFDGYLGRSAVAVNGTRGSEVKIGNLQDSKEGFGVFGYHNTTDHNSETGQPFNANLFNNQQVTYDKTNSKWTYSPLKFWPSDGHIDFLAYAPYNVGTVDNKYCLDFTVSKTITEQKDLLWAKTEDQTMANNSGTNKVKFQFKHALSRLGYSVKLYKDFTPNNVKFTLKEITLAGSDPKSTAEIAKAFYQEGTIDLSTGNWKEHSKDAAKQDFNWLSESHDVTSATESAPYTNSPSDYLFVIPQNFLDADGKGDKLYVIVTYDITYNNDPSTTITNKVYKQIKQEFKPGKAYKLNLTLGLPIEFDVAVDGVDGWGEEENINIGSNDNNPWDR